MQKIFAEYDCENKTQYLEMLADENDVPLSDVQMLADILGDNELFDGLVTSVEDMGGGWM